MVDWFANGRVVDGILLLMLLEWGALLLMRKKLPPAVSAAALWPTLAAGAALLMALRAALTGTAWTAVAPWLLIGLLAHVIDLVLRWRRSSTASRA